MDRSKVGDWSLKYYIVKQYVALTFKSFYRKVEVCNKDRVPPSGPVIFAPNHQNALMDALAILCTLPIQPVFLARQDIFSKKMVINILTFLKIMPIYRIRDGISNLNRNDEIFDATMKILRNKKYIGIMPEGNHGDKRRLRPLVKGIFRIAFQAQETIGDNDDVKIIPVGLDYGDYEKFKSTLLVNYGEPIEVKEYMELYRENAPKALNMLKDRLSEGMRGVMIDIKNDDFYNTIQNLREIYTKENYRQSKSLNDNLYNRFLADRNLVERLEFAAENEPAKMDRLKAKVDDYLTMLKKNNFRSWLVRGKKYPVVSLFFKCLILLPLFPLHLFGLLNNYLPYKLADGFAGKMKDRQFRSSVKYVVGIILFPIYYLIISVIILILTKAVIIALAYLVLMPFSGQFSIYYYFRLRKLWAKFRYNAFFSGKRHHAGELLETKKEIFMMVEEIVNQGA